MVLGSLRERPTDIPLLARHLVRQTCERLHESEPALPDSTLEALLEHDWPGNVRELENCLTRAIALSTGGVIRPEHLGLGPDQPAGVFRSLDEIEGEHVRRVLFGVGGNKAKAARVLGISKPRLYRLLEKHAIE